MPSSRRPPFWPRLLWALILPTQRLRAELTVSGAVLIALAFGVGSAAYNSSNNILFLALSLLMASLILSGVLSWLNVRQLEIDLRGPTRSTAGKACASTIVVRNPRRWLPCFDLEFEWRARPAGPAHGGTVGFAPAHKDPGSVFRRIWTRGEKVGHQPSPSLSGSVLLGSALAPGGVRALPCAWTPDARGLWELEVLCVVSLFPFGFLRKRMALKLRSSVLAWPARVDYVRERKAPVRSATGSERRARLGFGSDLHSLREYRHGDSHRLIHWKASARTGQLIVRQYAAEAGDGCRLWVNPEGWASGPRFERMLSLAAALAEDLHGAGNLLSWRMASGNEHPMARPADLEALKDALAQAEPGGPAPLEGAQPAWATGNVVEFAPEGAQGVLAHAGPDRIASA